MKISGGGLQGRACGLLDGDMTHGAKSETRERSERRKFGASGASEEKFHAHRMAPPTGGDSDPPLPRPARKWNLDTPLSIARG